MTDEWDILEEKERVHAKLRRSNEAVSQVYTINKKLGQ